MDLERITERIGFTMFNTFIKRMVLQMSQPLSLTDAGTHSALIRANSR